MSMATGTALASTLIALLVVRNNPILHVKSQPANDFLGPLGLMKNQCNTMLNADGTCVGDDAILEGLFHLGKNELTVEDEEPQEEDPMLAKMPTVPNFKAYRRADISSFYQEPPGSRVEQKPSFTGQAGKFVNMSPFALQLRW